MLAGRINRRHVVKGAAAFAAAAALSPRRSRAQEPKTKITIGDEPLISSGPIIIAVAKNYFQKVNLDVDIKYFADGALAIPALIAGEIDCTVSTLYAGLFNAVSKGAPY